MSKLETTKRHILIINKLRRQKSASFSEIANYLKRESELQGLNFNISLRTFQRDIVEIGEIYHIYIKYNPSSKCYEIEEEFESDISDRIFEAFDIYNALKVREHQSQHILLESRRPQGTENIYDILQAIKAKQQLTFHYQKYSDKTPTHRTVNPFVIKEFRSRWYLIAEDVQDDRIKSFGIDRISNLNIESSRFQSSEDFDAETYFKHCFGLIHPYDSKEQPQHIVLSFSPKQGLYIKSLPLHSSQKILIDNETELCIELKIYLTQDFIMEILSFGKNVNVMKSLHFAEKVKKIYEDAIKNYRK